MWFAGSALQDIWIFLVPSEYKEMIQSQVEQSLRRTPGINIVPVEGVGWSFEFVL